MTDAVRRHLKELDLMVAMEKKKDASAENEAKVIEVIGYGHFGDGKFVGWMNEFLFYFSFGLVLSIDGIWF